MTTIDIAWLAGLLEGEGSFAFSKGPAIQVLMTDEDIISKARSLMSPTAKIGIETRENCKTRYYFSVSGSLAIQWMMTIYPFMGRRRREKIREIILKWKQMYGQKHIGTITMIAKARNISYNEAKKIFEGSLFGTVQ